VNAEITVTTSAIPPRIIGVLEANPVIHIAGKRGEKIAATCLAN
jgi:hypothetical protein